ncbi:hypothetical protein N9L68_07005 [bacterium]|nr:hypothetical protein [bacterium]
MDERRRQKSQPPNKKTGANGAAPSATPEAVPALPPEKARKVIQRVPAANDWSTGGQAAGESRVSAEPASAESSRKYVLMPYRTKGCVAIREPFGEKRQALQALAYSW